MFKGIEATCGSFWLWLGYALEWNNMTVEELASRLRMSKTTVYSWMKGKTKPGSWSVYKEVCNILGGDANELYALRLR